MAEMLADPSNDFALEDLQEWTQWGHGLRSYVLQGEYFPRNLLVYFAADGFLRRYLESKGYTLMTHVMAAFAELKQH